MNKIFIEAKHDNTSEFRFLKTVLSQSFQDREFAFIFMDGVDNLFSETILNQIRQAKDEGDNVLVVLDADFPSKGWGFAERTQDVIKKMRLTGVNFPFFLYPNNQDDGDVECLMEALARKDLHAKWWDCFGDYEKCVKGIRDGNGNLMYNIPNRKAKLHTYISSQQLSNKQRDKVGRGHWLFDNAKYWDLSKAELIPLLNFFGQNIK